jgi:hypothetical protein
MAVDFAPSFARHSSAVPRSLAASFLFAALAWSAAAEASGPTTMLTAKLTGSYLHASPKGSGTARITLTADKVCWKFTYTGIDAPGDSGIHHVPPPSPGKHKTSNLPFVSPTTTKPGCAAANPTQVELVLAHPGDYYVIVASKTYPQGAIGGVLHAQ